MLKIVNANKSFIDEFGNEKKSIFQLKFEAKKMILLI